MSIYDPPDPPEEEPDCELCGEPLSACECYRETEPEDMEGVPTDG